MMDQPTALRSCCRVGLALGLLFAAIYGGVYEATPMRPYATLPLAEKTHVMRFSPDGGTLLTVGDQSWAGYGWNVKPPLRVWDVGRGIERFSVAADWSGMEPQNICFSPDGRLFAADQACYGLSVWDARTGEEFTVATRICLGEVLQFSPDGQFLLFETRSDSDGLVYLIFWDIRAGRELCRIEGSTPQVVFAADGRSFATTRHELKDGLRRFTEVSLWSLDLPRRPTRERSHPVLASSVAFSPDLGAYATTAFDGGKISLWDMPTGVRRFADGFDEPDSRGAYLRFLQKGRILTAGNEAGKTIGWDIESGLKRIGSYVGPQPWGVGYGEPSPDGEYLAVPLDDEWDSPRMSPFRPPDVGARLIKLSTLEEAGRLVMEGDSEPFTGNCCPYPSVQFSPDGKMLAVGGMDEPVREPILSKVLPTSYNPFPSTKGGPVARLWDVASRTHLMAFPQSSVQFSPDGKVLAALHDDQVIDLWRLPFARPFFQIFVWTTVFWLAVICAGLWMWKRLLRDRSNAK